MDMYKLDLPLLAHPYVPHFVKVGPGPNPDPWVNVGIHEQVQKQRFSR